MREIKFRFWTGKEMIYNGYEDANCWFHGILVCEGDTIPLQWTGLRDKNKKEIYEGDILEHDLWGKTYVIFEHGMFRAENGKKENDMIDVTMADHQLKRTRIIGNIYENKELIF